MAKGRSFRNKGDGRSVCGWKINISEIFYDLIYVYAISRLTLLIEEPEGGIIPLSGFLRYIVVCFVILQAWLYLTNYVNRYGRWKWYEYGLTAVNMTAAVYMANTISPEWNEMSLTFNLAMLVMLLCVAAMYFIQTRLKEQDAGATKNSLIILTVDCILYFAAILMAAALALFFIAIYADSVYYHERFSLAEKIRAEVGKTDSKAGRKDLTVGGQQKNQ